MKTEIKPLSMRQHLFVQALIKYGNQQKAYLAIYPQSSPAAASSSASRLMNNLGIMAYLDQLLMECVNSR